MKQNFLILIGLIIVQTISAQMDKDQDLLVLEQVSAVSSNSRVSDIEIVDNQIYIAGRDGIVKLNREKGSTSNSLQKGEAKSLKVTDSGVVLSGFSNNILYIDDYKVFQMDSYNPMTNESIYISDIEEYNNKMYVGTNDGIFVFNLTRKVLEQHINTQNSKLESNTINFLFADTKDRLWIGTDSGIMHNKKVDGKWSFFDADLKYIAATENKEGVWLIADQKMWLVNSTDDQWADAGLNKGLHKGKINDLVVDNEGHIYIASDILVKFNPYTEETMQYSDILGMASKKALALECDSENVIWLGTDNAGLFRITTDPTLRAELMVTSIIEEGISCPGEFNGKIKVAPSGGVGPYLYKWSSPLLRGDNPSGLKAGEYTVTVTDSKGSNAISTTLIEDAKPIAITVVNMQKATDASRKDGKCDIEVTGGNSPYDVLWDNGEKGTSATKLNFGFHYITITDANGCKEELKINVNKETKMKSLQSANLEVGEKLRIENLYFKADSSNVQDNSIDALEDIFVFLEENNKLVIEIGGHTNNIPPDDYCDQLSSARAKSVADYLIRRGIPESRISSKGYGKRDPIASNETQSGRKRNQRVEMKIMAILD